MTLLIFSLLFIVSAWVAVGLVCRGADDRRAGSPSKPIRAKTIKSLETECACPICRDAL